MNTQALNPDKPKLRIWFTDMWGYENYLFNPRDNYFYHLLAQKYDLILDDSRPSLLIYSCFGLAHKNYDCKKILFSGENIPNPNPLIKINYDPNECDLFLGKFPDSANTIYMPLWVIFIDWFGLPQPRDLPSNPTYHTSLESLHSHGGRASSLINENRKYCCFINNNQIYDRLKLFLLAHKHGAVDSYGKLYNNTENGLPVRGSELSKLEILDHYWLTIAFENSFYPGYNTEKIIHPYSRGCLPFYNGGLDQTIFNAKSMFYLKDYDSYGDMIDDAYLTVTTRELLYEKLSQPLFIGNKIPSRFYPSSYLQSICDRIDLNGLID